jgi:anion-transporting  ArsA/GET3 family ATPase
MPVKRSRLAHMLLSGVLRGLERFTGIGLVREIGDFVGLIENLVGALRARVQQVEGLLKGDDTAIVLVAAPEPRLVSETEELVRALGGVGLRVDGVVLNRVLPRALYGPGAPAPGPPDGVPPGLARRLAEGFAALRALAARQEAALAPLLATAGAAVLAEVPMLATPPVSLADLDAVAGLLLPPSAAVAPSAGVGG